MDFYLFSHSDILLSWKDFCFVTTTENILRECLNDPGISGLFSEKGGGEAVKQFVSGRTALEGLGWREQGCTLP